MWVFEPDFVVSKGRVWADKSIATIAGAADSVSSKRPDIVAITALSASLQSGHQWRDIHRTGVLVVDLKGTGTRIGAGEKQKASEYSRELIKTGVAKATTSVDCFVIGKEIDEDEGAPRVEGWLGNVRIVPLSYDQLIARAKRLTIDLVRVLAATPERFDDKVHNMPVDEQPAAESMDVTADGEDIVEDGHDAGHDADAERAGHDADTEPVGKPVNAKEPQADKAGAEDGHHDDHHDEHHSEQRVAAPVSLRRRMAAE
jgi:hypothetical protein